MEVLILKNNRLKAISLALILSAIMPAMRLTLYAQAIDEKDSQNLAAHEAYLSAGLVYPISSWPTSRGRVEIAAAALGIRTPFTTPTSDHSAYAHFAFSPSIILGGATRILPEEDPGTIDFLRRYLSYPDLARLDLGAEVSQGIAFDMGFQIDPEWLNDYGVWNNFPVLGKEGNPFAVDNQTMERADLRYGGRQLELAFGRAPVKWGIPGQTSFYFNDAIPYLDRAGLGFRIGPIYFDWLIATNQPVEARFGPDVTPNEGVVLIEPAFGFEDEENPTTVLIGAKRVQYRTERFSLGLGQVVIYSRRNNYFLLTDILPIMDWHATDIKPNNLALILDGSWAIAPGWLVSGMVGFDDISAELFGVNDSGVPTIPAWTVGLQTIHDIGKATLFSLAEAGYTHYLWGNFDGSKTFKNGDVNPLARAIYRYKIDKGTVLLPLTSPYGPGSFWVFAKATLSPAGKAWSAGMELELLWKHQGVNLVDTPFQADESLNGIPPFGFATVYLPVSLERAAFMVTASPGLELNTAGLYPALKLEATLKLGASGRL
jgi:hypothetical protein